MSKKSNINKNTGNEKTFGGYEFVNAKVEGEHKAHFTKWFAENSDDIQVMLESVLSAGYKVSFKYADDFNAYFVSFIGNQGTAANHNLILSSRHPDCIPALALTLYKHYVMFDCDAWEGDFIDDTWG